MCKALFVRVRNIVINLNQITHIKIFTQPRTEVFLYTNVVVPCGSAECIESEWKNIYLSGDDAQAFLLFLEDKEVCTHIGL